MNLPKFIIAGERFRFKRDVEARIRAIKDRAPMYVDIEAQDEKFIRSFFAWQPTKADRVKDALCIRIVSGLYEGDRR